MHEEMYEKMCELWKKYCKEIADYNNKEVSFENAKTVDLLAHAAKNILKNLEGFEQMGDGGSYAYYDEDPRTTAMGGSMRGSYNGGGSYGGSYRMSGKRDSMGRYSRAGGNGGGSYDGGMSNRGYSRGNNVTDGLRELMYAAPQEMQGEIQRLIKKLDNM